MCIIYIYIYIYMLLATGSIKSVMPTARGIAASDDKDALLHGSHIAWPHFA